MKFSVRGAMVLSLNLLIAACGGEDSQSGVTLPTSNPGALPTAVPTPPTPDLTFTSTNGLVAVDLYQQASVYRPYAVAPLSNGYTIVVQVRDGLRVLSPNGNLSVPIKVPANIYYPFDVITASDFATSGRIYITYAELGPDRMESAGVDDGRGNGANLAVLSGKLTITSDGQGVLSDGKVIWRQTPRFTALGEFGARMCFSPDGRYLFLTAGDRSQFEPAQALDNTIGKIVRLLPDGSIPADNPYVTTVGAKPEIWTVGHRNPYGIDFDESGRLWSHEHGPAGGDEFNLIVAKGNYGWPLVSYGNHYDGGLIAKPANGDGFNQSATFRTPAIAPSGLTIYKGSAFPALKGKAVIGALRGKALVIAAINADGTVNEVDRIELGFRVRDVRSGSDGSIWVVEDAENGRIFKVRPKR